MQPNALPHTGQPLQAAPTVRLCKPSSGRRGSSQPGKSSPAPQSRLRATHLPPAGAETAKSHAHPCPLWEQHSTRRERRRCTWSFKSESGMWILEQRQSQQHQQHQPRPHASLRTPGRGRRPHATPAGPGPPSGGGFQPRLPSSGGRSIHLLQETWPAPRGQILNMYVSFHFLLLPLFGPDPRPTHMLTNSWTCLGSARWVNRKSWQKRCCCQGTPSPACAHTHGHVYTSARMDMSHSSMHTHKHMYSHTVHNHAYTGI